MVGFETSHVMNIRIIRIEIWIDIPICSMYGIFTYIWVFFGANVGKYSSTMEHMGFRTTHLTKHQRSRDQITTVAKTKTPETAVAGTGKQRHDQNSLKCNIWYHVSDKHTHMLIQCFEVYGPCLMPMPMLC